MLMLPFAITELKQISIRPPALTRGTAETTSRLFYRATGEAVSARVVSGPFALSKIPRANTRENATIIKDDVRSQQSG